MPLILPFAEWFSPAYKPYGHISFPGGAAHNAFNGSCCDPYIGYVPVDDFLEDSESPPPVPQTCADRRPRGATKVQKPQMEALFYNYDTEILW